MQSKILPFRELLESTPDAMVIVNEAGEIVLINSQTEKLFGYDREELLGHSVERLIPARFQDRHLDHTGQHISAIPRTSSRYRRDLLGKVDEMLHPTGSLDWDSTN